MREAPPNARRGSESQESLCESFLLPERWAQSRLQVLAVLMAFVKALGHHRVGVIDIALTCRRGAGAGPWGAGIAWPGRTKVPDCGQAALDVGCIGVHLLGQSLQLLAQAAQVLVNLAPAAVHLQA